MIQRVDGLGLSLKPPSWLTTAISNLTSGKPATVPLPTGGSVQVTTPNTQPQQPAIITQAEGAVASIPGGWLTIAAIGAGAIFLLPRLFRGRR